MSNNETLSKYEQHRRNQIKLIKWGITAGVGVILLLILVFRSFYTVNEQQNAILTQFGSVVRVDTAGFYFKAPWQSVTKVDMTTHGTGIGYTVSEDGQNITDTDTGIMITSDFNLLNIDFYLEYRVSDPVAYVYNSANPEQIMTNIAQANIRTVVSNYTVDEAMTTAKGQIQADIKAAILEELEEANIGLTVVNITIQDSEPPTPEIISAFRAVETAKQGADTAMNQALQYQNSQIPAANAQADSIVQQATADRDARIAEANGQVERFNQMYDEYVQFPEVTRSRLFYERMEEILPNCTIIITDGSTQTSYPLAPYATINNGGEN